MNKHKVTMPNPNTNTNISNNKNANLKHSNLNVSLKSNQPTSFKQTPKTFLICGPSAITVAADTICNTRTDNKNTTLSTSPAPQDDNTHATTAIAPHIYYDNPISAQPLLAHIPGTSLNNNSDNNINNINFTSAAAMEKTPSREHAIVFNSIGGIPQIQYILAIGKIVQPKNIKFVSRISNNRFCIFLSNKQILDKLMQTTKHITIDDHVIQIRRLINPAKRFIISNVCPSIPNQAIVNALRNIDIVPMSQITHHKAGIYVEDYEHILSFHRQMYINHEDVPKLPSSLLINVNENQFRIFFTDDKITCFLC
jgi:hypothetical protein